MWPSKRKKEGRYEYAYHPGPGLLSAPCTVRGLTKQRRATSLIYKKEGNENGRILNEIGDFAFCCTVEWCRRACVWLALGVHRLESAGMGTVPPPVQG
jgi:hypothetical protein